MFTKRIVQILIISILLLALLPVLQASAATVINVGVSESFVRQDTYQPLDPNTGGSVVVGTTTGSGKLTITNNAGVVLNNVDLTFSVGSTTGWVADAANTVPSTITNGQVKIQSFPIGGTVVVDYSPLSTYVPPVTLSSTYSANSVTDSLTSSTIIHLTATLNTAQLPSDVTTVASTITTVSANNPSRGVLATPDWTFAPATAWSQTLTTTPGSTTATRDITATVNDVAALNDLSNGVSVQPIGTSTAAYTITSSVASASGIALTSATGTTSQVTTDITKQFTGGQWIFTPKVTVTGPLTYTLTSVTEWAVDSGALGTTIQSNTFAPAAGGVDLTGSTWTGSGTQLLQFAYNGIPVGFMKPTIALKNTPAQFSMTTNGAVSQANGVTLVKSIWIINGYKVEVVKTVTPDASVANEYHIKIVATNTGTASTPPNVFIYDMIPSQFFSAVAPVSPTNIVKPAGVGATQQQQITSGTYNGWYAYYWNLGTLTASPAAGSSDTITYDVFGTGTYDATNLYVVGVDPAQSVSQQTTPALQTDATVVNSNLESVMAVGAMCLVLIGMIGTFRRRF